MLRKSRRASTGIFTLRLSKIAMLRPKGLLLCTGAYSERSPRRTLDSHSAVLL
uniref:Uncharacterized protein n=1 Tax=Anguilla anguilla TaxID=7936 RepID=A0A0E9QTG8_ANGAN